jgi:outer membrane protein TolC
VVASTKNDSGGRARVESARAQVDTADALYQQTSQQHAVGIVAQIDVNRSQIETLTQRQRLVSLQNDLAKQKMSLARLTGCPRPTNTTPWTMCPSRRPRR